MDRKKIFVYSSGFLVLGALLSGSLYFLHFHVKESDSNKDKEIADAHQSHGHSDESDEGNSEVSAGNEDEEKKTDVGPDQEEKGDSDEKDENVVVLTEEQIKKMGLEMSPLQARVIALTLARRGQIVLHPDGAAHVLPKMRGVAKETRKNLGDYVNSGEVLAILESQDMADAKASYPSALNREQLAYINLQRETRLYNKRISPKQDYFNAQAAFREAQINTELTKQKLKASGLNEEDLVRLAQGRDPDLRVFEIRSPMSGVVIGRHITKGEQVDEKSSVYEIADLGTVWIEIGIYPDDLAMVKEGQSVNVRSPFDESINEAKVFYLSPVIENETVFTKAVAELNNPHWKWKPGMFVNVDIATANIPVEKAIHKQAIQSIDGKDCLFVQGSKGFEKRFVKLGKSDGQFSEILDGIEENDRCVVNNALLLKAEMGKGAIEDDD